MAVALTSAQAATTSMQQVVSEVHDLYAANGPGIDRNAQSSNTTGSLTTERWRASSTNLGQGGLAHAQIRLASRDADRRHLGAGPQ